MYSYVIGMSLLYARILSVCTRISFVCDSYALVCNVIALLFMSISIRNQVTHWHGIQTDFVSLGTKPDLNNDDFMQSELIRTSLKLYTMPTPSSRKQGIFIAWVY